MKKYILLLSLVSALISCEKDTEPSNFAPELVVYDATDIYRFGATLGGNIQKTDNCKIAECGIMYSIYPYIQQAQTLTVGASTEGNFTVNLTGLDMGQKYFYCTYASSGYSTVRSETKSFSTLKAGGPVFGVTTVENLSPTGMDVSTPLIDDGGDDVTEFGYVYKQVESEEDRDFRLGEDGVIYKVFKDAGSKDADKTVYRARISGLLPGKRYGVRPYGKSVYEGYGEAVFGVTDMTSEPVVSLCTLSDTTATTITVSARMLSEGTSAVTERGFCYSTETKLPTVDNLVQRADGSSEEMKAVLTNLIPQQTYRIRAYAKNSSGYGYGEVTEYLVLSLSAPTVATSSVTDITETSAKVSGVITSDGGKVVTTKGFCWSTTNTSPTVNDSKHEMSGEGTSFSTVLTGLVSGQRYYVRFYAGNGIGISYGDVMEFTTIVNTNIPVLAATTVSEITKTSARALSAVTSDGGATVTEKGFCISSTNATPTVGDRKIVVATAADVFNTVIDGLTEGTTYYIRSYAVNKNGTSYGAVHTFTTVAIELPSVTTSAATDITETSAKVSGSITSNGNGKISAKGFCWSTTNAAPTVSDSKHEVSGEGTSFATVLTGLAPGQRYYVRFYAVNEKGMAYGETVEFTTVKTDAPVLAATAVFEITQTSARASSSVTSDGGADITEKGFCISSTNANPTVGDRKITVSTATNTFNAVIDGLTEGTTYHIRAYAINKNGTSYGAVHTFTTVKTAIPDISGVWYCVEESNSGKKSEYTLSLNEDGSIQVDGMGYSYLTGSRWSLSQKGSFTATGHIIATQTQNTWDRYSGTVDDMNNPTKITGTRYVGNVNQVANVENAVGTFTMTRTSSKLTPSEGDQIFPETE